jgi:hypothetical protein
MSSANATWGSPRIVGELAKIGITASKSTAGKYVVRRRKPPPATWRACLKNHVGERPVQIHPLLRQSSLVHPGAALFDVLETVVEMLYTIRFQIGVAVAPWDLRMTALLFCGVGFPDRRRRGDLKPQDESCIRRPQSSGQVTGSGPAGKRSKRTSASPLSSISCCTCATMSRQRATRAFIS